MRIFESILDNIDSENRSASEELSTSLDSQWSPWGTQMTGEDYNMRIVANLVFTYNLNDLNKTNLKEEFSEAVSYIVDSSRYIEDISNFQFLERSKRNYTIAVAFKLSDRITPEQFLQLNIHLYKIVQRIQKSKQQLDVFYPYKEHWNLAKKFVITKSYGAIHDFDYWQWKSHEAFCMYVYHFVKKPSDDRSFEDESISRQWLEHITKRIDYNFPYDQYREYRKN